ncbi:hypothetical protein CVD28_19780 [Bacillus sp. M6-12]|uniref:DUF4097 family beta strand repeat-containing protein n=1 Tax=Bacillus sp. M6-12 TaxID=2054166 RepID=UPI000C75E401|nr:DUF4097 family beta strand repeat-containing protein [Bacillus sp. M6-12]PLS15982.1 hypothetical protein CVD28_19780 [Bacillus sp. M6-12]
MRKFVYGALATLIVGIVGLVLTVNAGNGFSFNTVGIDKKEEVNGKKITSVKVESPSTDVFLASADQEDISIELTGEVSQKLKNDFTMEVKEDGDTLFVEVQRKNKMKISIAPQIQRVKLHIRVPEKVYKSIAISTSSGDIDFKNLEAKVIDLHSSSGDIAAANGIAETTYSLNASSGDIKGTGNKAQKLSVSVSSGDINLKNSDAKENSLSSSSGEIIIDDLKGAINVKSSSGDIRFASKELVNHVNAEATSGDIEMDFVEAPQSAVLNFSSSSGDGKANLDGMSFDEKSEHSIEGKVGDGEHVIKVKTSSGDFEIN